ncbi:uncharacterized protein LOC144454548 [Phascolarctos cinereus]
MGTRTGCSLGGGDVGSEAAANQVGQQDGVSETAGCGVSGRRRVSRPQSLPCPAPSPRRRRRRCSSSCPPIDCTAGQQPSFPRAACQHLSPSLLTTTTLPPPPPHHRLPRPQPLLHPTSSEV